MALKGLGLLAVLALSGCSMIGKPLDFKNVSVSDTISAGQDAYKAATLSDEDVRKYAKAMAEKLDKENEVAPAGSPYTKRLAKLVAKYKKEGGMDLNYKVYVDPEVNAFSLADGTIRVHTGLMDKMNDEELLFVIGHEIGHVMSGHSKARLQRAYAASAATGALTTGLNAGAGSSVGGLGMAIGGDLLSDLVSEVVQAQFSQSDETESDEYGLGLLQRGKKNPQSAVKALMALADDDGESDSGSKLIAQFTSTHPDPKARAEHIQTLIAGGVKPMTMASKGDSESATSSDTDGSTAAVAHNAPAGSAGEIVFGDDAATTESTAMAVSPEPRMPDSDASYTPPSPARHGTWYVQVGAFSSHDNAQRLVENLAARQNPAELRESTVGQRPLYRVVVGPYESKRDAERETRELMQDSSLVSDAIVRRLGSM